MELFAKINQKETLGDEFTHLVKQLIFTEKERFKKHNMDYFIDPFGEIKYALNVLQTDKIWQGNWNKFITNMVFEQNPPTYRIALENLETLLKICLTKIVL